MVVSYFGALLFQYLNGLHGLLGLPLEPLELPSMGLDLPIDAVEFLPQPFEIGRLPRHLPVNTPTERDRIRPERTPNPNRRPGPVQ